MGTETTKMSGLDEEWVELMREARDIGLSQEEIRAFFVQAKTSQHTGNQYPSSGQEKATDVIVTSSIL
jgi:hypothetical protein